MNASAKGSIAQPGTGVRAKAGLNKAILDQGWFAFRTMLDYKLGWNGGWLVAVNPRNTSRTCGACEFEEHADLNAAQNILRAGRMSSAAMATSGCQEHAFGSSPAVAVSHSGD